jgi:biopolymer transport protein TolR
MLKRTPYSNMADINVTSLVDIMMVLLIIFMLTAPFLQAGIEVKLPRAKSTVIKESDAVVISITKDGKIFINDDRVDASQLASTLATLKAAGEDVVFVRADKDATHGMVMSVVGEVKAAGIDDVGMITEMKRDSKKRR